MLNKGRRGEGRGEGEGKEEVITELSLLRHRCVYTFVGQMLSHTSVVATSSFYTEHVAEMQDGL